MKHLFFIMLSASVLFSCLREQGAETPVSNDGTFVRLTIRTTQNKSVTRVIGRENNIANIDVLVLYYDTDAAQFRYQYTAEVRSETLSQDETTNQASFTVKLHTTTETVKLLVLCNAALPTLAEGSTEQDIRSAITTSYDGLLEQLPMSGEALLSGGVTPVMKGNIAVPVLRSVARARFKMDLDALSNPFVLSDVYVYRGSSLIQVFPDVAALGGTSQAPFVTAASVPTTAANSVNTLATMIAGYVTPEELHDPANATYISESLPLALLPDPTGETRIVVGGTFGTDTELSYYRIDFDSGLDGHPRGQILRNYDYIFTIKRVTARGYDNPDDAANNLTSSILTDLVPWADVASDIYVGDPAGDYMHLDTNQLKLEGAAGSTTSITLTSSVPFELGYDMASMQSGILGAQDAGTFSGVTISGVTTSSRFSDYTLTFSALTDNDTGLSRGPERLIIRNANGQWEIDVYIKQDVLEDSSTRMVRVLSAKSSYGSLGDHFGKLTSEDTGSADALRAALLNAANFGPSATGKVDYFGGFEFVSVASEQLSGTKLSYYLNQTDIFVTTYGYNPAVADCNIILDWLDKPGHVLFLACDVKTGTYATNVNLMNVLGMSSYWQDVSGLVGSLLASLTGAVNMSAVLDAGTNAAFINGRFGLADQAAGVNLHDGVSQFAATIPAGIVPLIVFGHNDGVLGVGGKIVRDGGMLMGVDPARRIVYMGEIQITNTYYLGVAPTILLNTWAWAVDRVLAGE